jgi:hypothetical protein
MNRRDPHDDKTNAPLTEAIASRGPFTREDEHRAAIERNALQKEWIRWGVVFHWDLWMTPTFTHPASESYAQRAAEDYVASLGPSSSALFAWGTDQPSSCHMLLSMSALWERDTPATGLSQRRLAIRRVSRLWKHGDIEVEPYDARRGVKAVRYMVDHHEVVLLIGEPKRHRVRR